MFVMSKKSALLRLTAVVFAVMVLAILLSHDGSAQTGVTVKFNIRYVEFDQAWNSYRMHVNISTNVPGHVTYVEEYYTIDGNNNPKYSASSRTDGGELVKGKGWYNASFDALRPIPHSGKIYTLVKSVVLINEERVFEYWLTKRTDFYDNTNTADTADEELVSEIQNVERHEEVDDIIGAGVPVPFKYSSLGVVSEIIVTGTGTDDVSLRVELLKSRAPITDVVNATVYRYLNVKTDSVRIGNMTVKYRVENAWMRNRSVPARNLRLYSWDGNGKVWLELPTVIEDNDSTYTYFESESGAPAYFAIAGKPVLKPKANATKGGNATGKSTAGANRTGAVKASGGNITPEVTVKPYVRTIPGFGYGAAIAVMFIVYINKYRRIKQ